MCEYAFCFDAIGRITANVSSFPDYRTRDTAAKLCEAVFVPTAVCRPFLHLCRFDNVGATACKT